MMEQFPHAVQDECWNLTYGMSEHIRSPGYPNNYSTNLDCRKIIKGKNK